MLSPCGPLLIFLSLGGTQLSQLAVPLQGVAEAVIRTDNRGVLYQSCVIKIIERFVQKVNRKIQLE